MSNFHHLLSKVDKRKLSSPINYKIVIVFLILFVDNEKIAPFLEKGHYVC